MATSKAMTSDLDIYRSAKLLIDQHGEDAAIHAAMQADKRAEAGDREGRRGRSTLTWLRAWRTTPPCYVRQAVTTRQ